MKGVLAAAERAFGRLDAIHANAGIGGGTVPFTEQSVELWEEVLRVNLIGAFLAIKHGAPLLPAPRRRRDRLHRLGRGPARQTRRARPTAPARPG